VFKMIRLIFSFLLTSYYELVISGAARKVPGKGEAKAKTVVSNVSERLSPVGKVGQLSVFALILIARPRLRLQGHGINIVPIDADTCAIFTGNLLTKKRLKRS
jgi:hypothetical protein